MTPIKLLIRLGTSFGAGVGAAILSALVIAVVDLYLTGHGYPSIRREIVSWEPADVHLSAGDIAALTATVITAILTWRSFKDFGEN